MKVGDLVKLNHLWNGAGSWAANYGVSQGDTGTILKVDDKPKLKNSGLGEGYYTTYTLKFWRNSLELEVWHGYTEPADEGG